MTRAATKTCPEDYDQNFFRYYNDLGRVEILDPKTERKLFKRYQRYGDLKARDKLLESCLRFVVTLAKDYSRDIDTLKDLVSAGNLGLMKALDRYDPDRGTRFLSYATHWVLLSIRTELYKRPLVTMPSWRQKAIRKIKIAQQRIVAQNGHATEEELASEVDLSTAQLKRLQVGGFHYLCLEDCQPIPADDLDEATINKDTGDVVRQLLHTLGGKEKFVIKNYFGIGIDKRSLRQIADILGITPERVRQIKMDALKRLRRSAKHGKKLTATAEVVV